MERTTGAGHRSVLGYDLVGMATGYLQSIVTDADGVGHSQQFEYDMWGNVSAVIDGAGRRVERVFNELGQLRVFRRPQIAGSTDDTRYFYSLSGQLRRVEMPRGDYSDEVITDAFIASELEYNAIGQLVESRRAVNTAAPQVVKFSRDAEGRALETTDPLGRVGRRVYDERGLLARQTDAVGLPEEATYRYTYDLNGNCTSLTDPTGYRFDYTYDPWDRVSELAMAGTEAERTRIRLRVNRFDLADDVTITGLVAPSTVGTLFYATSTYDERGRLVRRQIGDRAAICTHDPDERLIVRRDARGNDITFVFDGLNRVVQNGDPLGNLELRTFASDGTLTRVERRDVLPDGGVESLVSRFEYDERRRPRRIIDALGRTSTMLYDARDVLVAQIGPAGTTADYTVGVNGEVTSLAVESVPGHRIVHGFVFDRGGRQVAYADPLGRVTGYEYDARDRRTATTYPNGDVRRVVYDTRLQRRRELTPNGTQIDYQYGPDAALARVEYTPGLGVAPTPPIDIVSDGLRRQVAITQNGQRLTRAYDAFSRLLEDTFAGSTTTVAYADAEGAIRRTYSDGRVDRIGLDELGRPVSVSVEATGAATALVAGAELARWRWRGRSRLADRTLPAGVVTQLDYDAASNLTSVAQVGTAGEAISTLRYVHDAAGLRRVTWAGSAPQTTTRLDYDGLSRLVGTDEAIALADPGSTLDAAGADAIIAMAGALHSPVGESYVIDDADGRLNLAAGSRTDSYTLGPGGQSRHWSGPAPTPAPSHSLTMRMAPARRTIDMVTAGMPPAG